MAGNRCYNANKNVFGYLHEHHSSTMCAVAEVILATTPALLTYLPSSRREGDKPLYSQDCAASTGCQFASVRAIAMPANIAITNRIDAEVP